MHLKGYKTNLTILLLNKVNGCFMNGPEETCIVLYYMMVYSTYKWNDQNAVTPVVTTLHYKLCKKNILFSLTSQFIWDTVSEN